MEVRNEVQDKREESGKGSRKKENNGHRNNNRPTYLSKTVIF